MTRGNMAGSRETEAPLKHADASALRGLELSVHRSLHH